ncbi:protein DETOXIFICATION 56 [Ricinus communis]|uniref:Protein DETOXIFICATION n=1 Tax=Ricinus communis TaxID=3988 RepID=B9RBV0_RICCO|nr:protein DETOXIFICATION 56 [Ricinus communis]EEF51021.1 multidrug resistance pump, putative [Ricinus communis]|eukprot:XP_002509634.1 protein DETOXIFICATION 56 [Ricinus communis]
MFTIIPKFEENTVGKTSQSSPPHTLTAQKWPANLTQIVLSEMRTQRGMALPLLAMNLTWFAKTAITTAFLGRLGELRLAGGTLGFTFANVTGFSVLNGLCGAMEPICGQAYGAKNFRLLHKTLLMTTFVLLLITLPVSFLWLNVDKILIHFGQQEDISLVARTYLFYLLPDLAVISLLCPLKAYLSSQGITLPIMFSSGLALALHLPINIFLVKAKGLEGVSMSIWITDLIVVVFLALYVLVTENRKGGKWKDGGWLDQGVYDWLRLLKLSAPCCLSTCLEWWCWEILVLLTGRLANAKQAVGVIAIVLNFDYLLFSVMLTLATCASIRVSNELGANQAGPAYRSAYVSLAVSLVSGFFGGLAMVGGRGIWAPLFTHDKGIIRGAKKMMLLMALIEVINFPLAVCGGVVRGTARPWLAMYSNLGGFYLLALPVAVLLAFKARLGLGGLLLGFLVGLSACLALLVVFIMRIDWDVEADKAQKLASDVQENIQRENQRPNRTPDDAEV